MKMSMMIIIFLIIVLIIFLSYTKTKTKTVSKGILKDVLFFTNVLPQEQYNRLLDECNLLQPYLKEQQSSTIKRKTIHIEPHSYLFTLFYGNPFLDYLHTQLGFRVKPSSNLPIEFRMYEKGGKMYWHRDNVVTVI